MQIIDYRRNDNAKLQSTKKEKLLKQQNGKICGCICLLVKKNYYIRSYKNKK